MKPPRAARDCLLVLEPGFAEVCMDVDEARADDEAACVDRLIRVSPSVRADFGDVTIGDQDVCDGVDPVPGVHHAAATDGEGRHGLPLASR